MEDELRYFHPFWYTRFQGGLFLLALFSFGLGDALTSAWMIERQGLMSEGNMIVRNIISYYGILNFIQLKIWFTLIILMIPFLLQSKSRESIYWMTNGYLASFFVCGALAMTLNLQAAVNEPLFLQPEIVILIFISLIIILTNLGEFIDKMTQPVRISYVDCVLNDITIFLGFVNNAQEKRKPEFSGRIDAQKLN